MLCAAVLVIKTEETDTHKLERRGICPGPVFSCIKFLSYFKHGLFDLTSVKYRKAFRIQSLKEILVRTVGLRIREKIIIQTDLCIKTVLRINPVNGSTFNLTSVSRISAALWPYMRRILL